MSQEDKKPTDTEELRRIARLVFLSGERVLIPDLSGKLKRAADGIERLRSVLDDYGIHSG